MDRLVALLKIIKLKIINIKYIGRSNIILSRDNNYNNSTIKFSSRLIKARNKNDIELFSEKLKNFLIVMNKDCKNFNPDIFLTNFKKTFFDIKEIDQNKINGYLNFDLKVIRYYIQSLICTNHEFLHLSAVNHARYNEFMRYILPFEEGYTTLLDARYFYNGITSNAYIAETIIMKNIEVILGRDYLEESYFNGNFSKFIFELENYESSENINELFYRVNKLWELEEYISNPDINDVKKNINIIFNILFSCLKNKLKKTDNKKEKLKILANSNFNSFSLIIGDNEEKVELQPIDKEEFNKLIKETLENNSKKI